MYGMGSRNPYRIFFSVELAIVGTNVCPAHAICPFFLYSNGGLDKSDTSGGRFVNA